MSSIDSVQLDDLVCCHNQLPNNMLQIVFLSQDRFSGNCWLNSAFLGLFSASCGPSFSGHGDPTQSAANTCRPCSNRFWLRELRASQHFGSSVFKCKTSRIGPSGPWPSGGCARSSSRSLATPDSSPGSIGPTDSSLTSVHRYAW